MDVGTSIAKIGFFGEVNQKLWCLTHIETVDYFVDTNAGTIGYFPVYYKGVGAIHSPEAILEGGHLGIVRTVLPVSSIGKTRLKGIFGWTGGEDGSLCCWLSDESSQPNRSWVSSALVMKSLKAHKKKRHNPY